MSGKSRGKLPPRVIFPLTVDRQRVMRVRGACGRRAKEWLWMLDAGTLVCSRSSSRKRVSSDWAMPSWCWCTARITASRSLACRVESRRAGLGRMDWGQ